MMNQMLYPELFPALSNPSSGFTLTQSGLKEIGLTTSLNFSSTFNRGTISPAYGTNGFRSGLPNSYNYTSPGNILPASITTTATTGVSNASTSDYTVVLGTQSFTVLVNYDTGEQPLDSIGDDYSSPLLAGYNPPGSSTASIYGVYPTFATSVALPILKKQSLQSMSITIQVSLVTESLFSSDRQMVDIPNAWSNISSCKQYDSNSGIWQPLSLSTWTTSNVTQTIQGNTVNYTRYTNNDGFPRGPVQIRFLT
jgi:hypothetical protein